MTPDQFLRQVRQQGPAETYLFIGPELYMRDRCRHALIEAVLPDPADRDQGFTRHDLADEELPDVLDDARTLSLFATRRVIWVGAAEGALPKGRGTAAAISDDDEGAGPVKQGSPEVAQYVQDPSPGTVLVVDCNRYDFEGDDRTKIDRVLKFYAAIPNVVEFRPFTPDAAATLAETLAGKLGLQIRPAEIGLLVDALGADAARIASELEKLSVFAGSSREITPADISELVPNAHENTIFELVSALGAGNRSRSLAVLDTLVREGEYLPLALTFLGTQLRMALVAREAGLRSAYDIQSHFTRIGIRIWRDRAEQVRQTLAAFPNEKLERALRRVAATDRGLRDFNPDDRLVMEELILSLTD
jgi:DNA polymerase-3 subunit delta